MKMIFFAIIVLTIVFAASFFMFVTLTFTPRETMLALPFLMSLKSMVADVVLAAGSILFGLIIYLLFKALKNV